MKTTTTSVMHAIKSKLRTHHLAAFASLSAAAAVLLVASDVYAQAAGTGRVTQVLDEVKRDIEKWYVTISAIATFVFTIIGIIIGVQWWEDRGRGKEGAKGLVMGAFFAFAVLPWIVTMAQSCGTGGSGG